MEAKLLNFIIISLYEPSRCTQGIFKIRQACKNVSFIFFIRYFNEIGHYKRKVPFTLIDLYAFSSNGNLDRLPILLSFVPSMVPLHCHLLCRHSRCASTWENVPIGYFSTLAHEQTNIDTYIISTMLGPVHPYNPSWFMSKLTHNVYACSCFPFIVVSVFEG